MSGPGGHSGLNADLTVSELVVSAQLGDVSASEELARRFLRAAYAVSLSIVRRPSDAEDVAQDALIAALSNIESCNSPASFSGWLMQIVKNQSYNCLSRRRLRDVPAADTDVDVMGQAPPSQELLVKSRLLKALDRLSETQRAVVLLHDMAGYTHPEIAEALNLSTVNSRQILFVARQALRDLLER